MLSLFQHVSLETMAEEEQIVPILKLVYQQVTVGKKPKVSAIVKIKSKAERKYLLQFNWLNVKKKYYIICISILM